MFTDKNRLSAIIFWASALLLLFWGLGDRGLWASEGRWAEITRVMFLSGDFLHPTINGEPYFDKPLLSYWLIAIVSAITGRLDEWTVRLPSAISGLLALWATTYLGRKLWSREVGRMAGWILLTTYGFLFWGRTAAADMENLAAITLAVAWYWKRRERPNFCSYIVFYLICSLGAQTKGLAAIVVPIVAVLPDFLRERRWKMHLSFSHLMALAIGAAIYLCPLIYSAMTREGYLANGFALVFRENIQRFINPFDHIEPFYVYLYYLPELFLPWTPLFLTAILAMIVSLKDMDSKTKWLLHAGVLIFLFFTASGSRRSYYILPILPFCALFTSVFLKIDGKKGWKRLGLGLQIGLFTMGFLVEILSPTIWPIVKKHVGFVPPGSLRLATLLLGILALTPFLLRHLKPDLLVKLTGIGHKSASLVATAAILMGGFFCWQQVILDTYGTERPFARELKAHLAGLSPTDIAFYRHVSPKILFYLDLPEPISVLKDPALVQNFLESDKEVKVLVLSHGDLMDLSPAFPEGLRAKKILREKVYPWEKKRHRKLVAWMIFD